MPGDRILILGGTGEARRLARGLIDQGFAVVTSLAGVTSAPLLPAGQLRRGGFGGEAGLADYVKRENIHAIIDATHPFAVQISRHGHGAAHLLGIAYCRLERPPWVAETADNWIEVAGLAEAVAVLPVGARPLLTIGRKEAARFFARADLRGVARMIEAPGIVMPRHWTLILARPPFSLENEIRLIDSHHISHVVTKNSGGDDTRAKLVAARERNIPVVMVARPVKPEGPAFSTVEALIPALRRMLSP